MDQDFQDIQQGQDDSLQERSIFIRGDQLSKGELAMYLLKAFLSLRDRENTEQYVKLKAIGNAIPSALLVNEILRNKMKNLSSICKLDSKDRTIIKSGQQIQITRTTLDVTLTLAPTEEQKQEAGYQAPTVKEERQYDNASHAQLFDYVMLYLKDLNQFQNSKKKQSRPKGYRPNVGNRQNERNEERERDKPKNEDWNKAREYTQRQEQGERGGYSRNKDERNNREQKRQYQPRETNNLREGSKKVRGTGQRNRTGNDRGERSEERQSYEEQFQENERQNVKSRGQTKK